MEGSVFCKIVRDQPTVPRERAQFWLSFEPKFIDFRQKLKFLAYFEIRDGKIRKNAYFPYKMRKKAILSHFSGHEGGLGSCQAFVSNVWSFFGLKMTQKTQNDPK